MDFADLMLAVVPPALAIGVDVFGIPRDKYLAAQGSAEQKKHNLPTSAATVISQTAKGAVSLSSMTPTLISFVTSSFVLFHNEPDAINYIFVIVGTSILITIVIIWMAQGRSLYDIPVAGIEVPHRLFGRGHIPVSMSRAISWAIRAINGILILLSIGVYKHLLPKW